ncbi:hypothetical protein C0416_03210 [bacterium]|nr:hypothetical protein [bacterium]
MLMLTSCAQQNHEIVDGKTISNEWELFIIIPSEFVTTDLGYHPTLEECKEEAQEYITIEELDEQNTKYICGTKCIVKWDDRYPSDCSIQEECQQDQCTRLMSLK